MKSFVVLSCVLAVAVAYVPADTPEVAAAKAQHFAAHQEAKARNWASDVVVNNQWVAAAPSWNSLWAARSGWYAPTWQRWYNPSQISVVNGHVQDTPEVAAEKAKHFALVAEAQARTGAYYGDDGQWVDDVSEVQVAPALARVALPAVQHVQHVQHLTGYVAPAVAHGYVAAARTVQPAANIVVANGHVQDTPEVAAEKAKHLAIFAETQARDAAAGSTEWADNAENWKVWGSPAAVSTYAVAAPVVSNVYPTWTRVAHHQPAHVVVADGHVQDTPEVALEKAKHFALVAEAKARNVDAGEEWTEVVAPVAPVVHSRVAVAAAPVAVAAPVAAPVAVADIHSQYHAQDEAGQYSYGYNGGLSTKNEEKTIDGVTRGAFSYVDANGVVQSRSYVADAINGFRVAASDLPAGPAPVVAAAPIATPVVAAAGPVVVARSHHVPAQVVLRADGTLEDTPEVAAAKAQHLAAHAQEHARQAGAAW